MPRVHEVLFYNEEDVATYVADWYRKQSLQDSIDYDRFVAHQRNPPRNKNEKK